MKAEYSILDFAHNIDASFDEMPFTEADAVIMSQVSRLKLNNCGIDVGSGNSKTISEIYGIMNSDPNTKYLAKDDKLLLKELATSERYKNLVISNYTEDPAQNEIDGFPKLSDAEDVSIEQFAAVTISYKEDGVDKNYISFRPTDSTLDGWTEDAALLAKGATQAQLDSANYINLVGSDLEGEIAFGGHSKGGNDAEYGYLFCDEDIASRVETVYLLDSPGLIPEVIAKTDRYNDLSKKTKGGHFCPQDSIVGILLLEVNNSTFIKSVESGVNEHDPYSWELRLDGSFVRTEQSQLSQYIAQAVDYASFSMSKEEREAFYSFVYLLLEVYADTDDLGNDLNGDLNLLVERLAMKNENGKWDKEKIETVLTGVLTCYFSLSDEKKVNFEHAVGQVFTGMAIVGVEAVDEYFSHTENRIDAVFVIVSYMCGGIVGVATYEAVKVMLEKIAVICINELKMICAWVNKNFNPGYKYASNNSYLKVNTAKMRDYSNRLINVNKQIEELDSRMNRLYLKVGFRDLWNLLKADLMTGYNWHIKGCADYLEKTASDFEKTENDIYSLF